MGEKGTPLTRVYRCLYSEDLFLAAYNKIGRNQGALTPGTEKDTVDGMSMKRIRNIIEKLRQERFHFKPARRMQIPKKSGGTRPLGIPNFSEKLVQEVLRMLLEAYYESRFRDSSHGFRPQRGCHTALAQIKNQFTGTKWFIEGDIRGCFDNIDHEVLMGILSKDILDGRLLELIRRCLQAGYMEDWRYHLTYSGTPQGGVLSPLLSNIYLHELDAFVEDELIPKYTRGHRRADNKAYRNYHYKIKKAFQQGDIALASKLRRERRKLPSKDTHDPNYRRLRYIRYADDFILGFSGPKSEASEIKDAVGTFLEEKLRLEMSKPKTLITHALTEHARFLGYAISIFHNDNKLTYNPANGYRTRNLNGGVRLGIPYGLVDNLVKRYQLKGKAIHEAALADFSDAHIIMIYQLRFRGIAQYYKYATDIGQLAKLKGIMQQALTKTLAFKYKTSVPKIYRKYHGTKTVDGYTYRTLQVSIKTKRGQRLFWWGALPLKTVNPRSEPVKDRKHFDYYQGFRSDLVRRLQADTCELCGAEGNCEVHHIRKLSDLKNRWRGRKEKPEWVKRMIAMQRKTMIVCRQCHMAIHAGRLSPKTR